MKNSDISGFSEIPISKEVVNKLLSHIPQDLILVGGQALAFWIEHYSIDATLSFSEKEPYVSRDADFLGTRDHVKMLAEIISGKTAYPPQRAMTILCGQVFVIDKNSKTFMNIDVIHKIGNMDSDAVRNRAATAAIEGNSFLVMHPLDVLVSRLENYRGIKEKREGNGLQQIKLSIEVAKHYLTDTIKRDESIALKAIEKIAETARSAAGGYARKSGAEVYDAINPATLENEIKDANFTSNRLPRLIAEINKLAPLNKSLTA
jgi:hypothetical protein